MKPLFKRLLFVDDEANIRATLAPILTRYGFTVTVAATVAEALAYIKHETFDVLVTDLNLEKEADGLEVIRAVRLVHPHCATIVLTGFASVDTAVAGIHLGIDDYISKPANADALVAVLAERLAARQTRLQSESALQDPKPMEKPLSRPN
jgi:ActR/RegA family two-component response regulator